jgi:hypothetical protein
MPFVKYLAGQYERLRANRERMMGSVIYFGCFLYGVLSLAKQDVVVPNVKAGHDGVAEAPQRSKAKQIAIELL